MPDFSFLRYKKGKNSDEKSRDIVFSRMHSATLFFLIFSGIFYISQCQDLTCVERPVAHPIPISSIQPALNAVQNILDENLSGNGVSSCIVYRGSKIWEYNSGITNKTSKKPPTSDTIFRIASLSKTFVLGLTLKAIEKGKIGFDDPIKKKVPKFNPTDPSRSNIPITWSHVISHTSGLPRYGPCDLFNCNITTNEILKMPLRLINTPGTSGIYSNYGYALLGNLVAEYLFKKDYNQLMKEFFFSPLDFKNTGFTFTDEVQSKMATGYDPAGNPIPAGIPDILWYSPAGQMYSSTNDIAKWMNALLGFPKNNPIFPEEIRIPLFSRTFYDDPNGITTQGLIWENVFVDRYVVHRKYGSINGFSAIMAMVPELELGISILFNTEGLDTQNIVINAMNQLLPAIRNAISSTVKTPPLPANLEKYVGTYTAQSTVGPLSAQIELTTFNDVPILSFTCDILNPKYRNYLVIPEDKQKNTLSIWLPPTEGNCFTIRSDATAYNERLYFREQQGAVKSFEFPGMLGNGVPFVKA